ncbi:MAG TPA: coenzyme F420-0:L-glutamate ligase [Candidatus Korarchaeota archaeon]|nr:coenzyme F420-0:L-glutamate ligase [Candidatus Korarchaeota archaeon]
MLQILPIGPIDPPIRVGEDFIERLERELDSRGLRLKDGDVIAVASKIVAYSQGRVVPLERWRKIDGKAEALAKYYGAEKWKAAAVLAEADAVLGGYQGYILTYKNGIAVGTAGIDRSNSPPSHVVLHPVDPDSQARKVVEWARARYGVTIGAIIVDSRLTLFRRGVIGVALGVWGLRPLKDMRGTLDIYGKPLRFTVVNVADSLAAAASLVMGEAGERIPYALIRYDGAEVGFEEGGEELRVGLEECYIYNSLLNPPPEALLGEHGV